MKAYILTGEPFPNGMAATNRIICYARAIKEGGIECEVLVFCRTEVSGRKPKNTEGHGLIHGIPYKYIGDTPLRGNNVFIRQIHDKLDIIRAKKYLQRNLQKGDVLFFYVGKQIRIMNKFMKVAHNNGAFCVRDLCELPFGTGKETKKDIHLREMTFKKQFPQLDGIISISDSLLSLAKTYASSTCKHIKVPIMVDYDHYKTEYTTTKESVPFIFHAGTLYEQKDGIIGMIEAFGKAREQIPFPVKYILTGKIEEASHPNELREIINKYNLTDSLEFVGYQTSERIKNYIKKASLAISNRPKSQQDYYNFSTKVGEYLASGTPLITTNWGEAVNWLKDGKSAYIIEPENTDTLAQAIVRVFNHPEEARRIGLAGQEVCRKCFDYRNWSKPLAEFMNQLGQ